MSLIRKHVAVLQAWACLALVQSGISNFSIVLWSLGNGNVLLFISCVLWPKTCRKCDSGLGELTTLPRPTSRLGRGHPSPYPTHSAPLAPRSSCPRPPDTKSWRRHWSPPLLKVKLRLWVTTQQAKLLQSNYTSWYNILTPSPTYQKVATPRLINIDIRQKLIQFQCRQGYQVYTKSCR